LHINGFGLRPLSPTPVMIWGHPQKMGAQFGGINFHVGASMKLTDIQCRTAKPKEKPYKMADGGGLYLEKIF